MKDINHFRQALQKQRQERREAPRKLFHQDYKPFEKHPLGRFLRDHKMTVKELSKILLVPINTIYRWLDGSRTIPNEKIQRIRFMVRTDKRDHFVAELVEFQARRARRNRKEMQRGA